MPGDPVDRGRIEQRVAAVIPAFNEAPSIARVVRAACAAGLDPIVVDDGSRDGTAGLAADAGAAAVIAHDRNRGKGAALATGFRAAIERGAGAAIAIDADGQHDPGEARRLIDARARTGADLVIGTRMRGRRGMPFVRWATNAMMSNLLSMLCGKRLTDTQCGMKLLSRRAVDLALAAVPRAAEASGTRFDIESEIVLVCARAGLGIAEAPISTIYVPGRRSRIRPLRDTLRFLWLVARHALRPPRAGDRHKPAGR